MSARNIERSFTDFIHLHEKKAVTDDIKVLEKRIKNVIENIPSTVDDNDRMSIEEELNQSLRSLKKILSKYQLYEI